MKLIVGLGNPGLQYEKTRHNAGFLFLDWFKNELNILNDWKNETKFKGEILETFIAGEKIILLKPQTFMNLSGESVLKIMSFYKIEKKDIIVIFDDVSLDFGKIRFRESGSAGGQNGVKSIIQNIGEEFRRIKIGIGQDRRFDLADWVLSKFSEEELKKLNEEIFIEVKSLLVKNL
ncbi:MAG: aminoacyl-tRNA hydrolase [Candidatus Gracilibacteria bacterium]|nr:aminoacyl-tRNA hydrolase [Candidatus Gracilibacteria bacterium]